MPKNVPATRAYDPSRDRAEVPAHLADLPSGPDIPLDSPLQFEQRVLYPSKYPVMEDRAGKGAAMTHRMATAETQLEKGGPPVPVAYPTVVYDGKSLRQLNDEEAFRHAMKTGDFRSFETPEQASLYAEGYYKKAWGKGDAVDDMVAKMRATDARAKWDTSL